MNLNNQNKMAQNILPVFEDSTIQQLLSLINTGQNILNELPEFYTEQTNLQELRKRLASSQFYLAVLGQFKRGKSTLLNALIGEELLPAAVVPLTSIPTFISWGKYRLIRVSFKNDRIIEQRFDNTEEARKFLAQYVTENQNPENKLGVTQVEVEHPSTLLQRGMILIDTPGIGSTLQHNTETTLNFLPQCDAALFLVSADPPVTQMEIEFLKAVRSKVVKIIFLMNKMDYLYEQERLQAVDFFKRVLREQGKLEGTEPVFSISARQGLEARATGNQNLWIESGMAQLENYLIKFLSEEKMLILTKAIARKVANLFDNVLLHARLKKRSFMLPMEDLAKRLDILNQKIREIDEQRELYKDILIGDKRRIIETLENECAKTLKNAEAEFSHIIEETIATAPDILSIEQLVNRQMNERIPYFFGNAQTKISDAINQLVQQALSRHQNRANALADTVIKTAAELFEIPFKPGNENDSIVTSHKPYWVTERWDVSMSPIPRGFFERFMPRNMAIRRIKKWLMQDVESIIMRNTGNIQSETRQNIDDTFGRFMLDLDQQLKEVAKITAGVIQKVHEKRASQETSINSEIEFLENIESRILDLQNQLAVYIPDDKKESSQ